MSLLFTCVYTAEVQVRAREGLDSGAWLVLQDCVHLGALWGAIDQSFLAVLSLSTILLHSSLACEPFYCSWNQNFSVFSPPQLKGRGCLSQMPNHSGKPKWGLFPILSPFFPLQAATGSRTSDCHLAHSARLSPISWTSPPHQPSCCSESWPSWPWKRLRSRGWRHYAR